MRVQRVGFREVTGLHPPTTRKAGNRSESFLRAWRATQWAVTRSDTLTWPRARMTASRPVSAPPIFAPRRALPRTHARAPRVSRHHLHAMGVCTWRARTLSVARRFGETLPWHGHCEGGLGPRPRPRVHWQSGGLSLSIAEPRSSRRCRAGGRIILPFRVSPSPCCSSRAPLPGQTSSRPSDWKTKPFTAGCTLIALERRLWCWSAGARATRGVITVYFSHIARAAPSGRPALAPAN